MRIFFLLTILLTVSLTAVMAQQKPLARISVERLLEEKLRRIDYKFIIDWQKNHPGEPLPGKAFQHTTGSGINERSADQVIAENPEAESEVHAAINPADSANIIAAGIVQDPSNFLAPLDIPVRYTKNFGQTWQTSNVDFNPGTAFVGGGGDPVIAFDKSGKAYVSWLVLTLDVFAEKPVTLALYSSTSTNKGQTWTSPVLIDKGSVSAEVLSGGNGTGSLVDKQWMATDQSNSAYEGNLYVVYTQFDIIDSLNTNTNILLKKKSKTSNTYGANAIKVHTNTYAFMQFSSITVDQDGHVHVSFTAGNNENDLGIYHTVSTDGGVTFAPEVKISGIHFPKLVGLTDQDTIPGINADRLYPCPHIAAGKTAGTLFATWTSDGITNAQSTGFDIWFSKSTNDGQTWSAPKKINAGTNAAHQFYSALYVNSNGVLCVSYYDRSADPASASTHYVVAVSEDEGATFKAPVNASSQSSDFEQIGLLNGGFGIGEYTQVVCTPHFAIPVWADGRTNDGNIDLYAAFLPLSGSSGIYEWGNLTDAFSLNIPNPGKQSIDLQFNFKKATTLKIEIYDANGRLIRADNNDQSLQSGEVRRHYAVNAGIYFCKAETQYGSVVRKVVVQ